MKTLSSCAVLIVDTNRHFCETLAEVIAADIARVVYCHTADTAHTEIAAAAKASEPFDVILWDATLPSPEAQLTGEALVITVAAEAADAAGAAGLTGGQQPFASLQKPFPPTTLLAKLTGMASRILLVSGNRMDYNLLSRRISVPQAIVEVSDNGWEALGLIGRQSYDLIIADTELSSVTSSHFLFQIRKQFSSLALPVILISSDHQRDRIALGLAQGANDFISRPYDFLTVNARIHTQLAMKHGELELNAAKDYALSLAATKSRFLANMSHEIRTPLNGIIGMTSLLTSTPLTAEQSKLAEIIQTSSSTLLGIVGDILDFSKIEAEKMEPENVAFCPGSLIEQTVAGFTDSAASKNLLLLSDVARDLPPRLRGAPGWIGQILTNFISNAIKFTAAGTIKVSAYACLAPPAEGTDTPLPEPRPSLDPKAAHDDFELAIAVEDTGKGLAEGYDSWLFQPFTQEDRSTTRNFGGTGLGLAICRRLVQLMGGKIGVQSEKGAGSGFWFTVPLNAAPGLHSLQVSSAAPEGVLAIITPHADLVASIGLAAEPLGIAIHHVGAEECSGQQPLSLPPFDYVLLDTEWQDWRDVLGEVTSHYTGFRGFLLAELGQTVELPASWQLVDKPFAMHSFMRKLLQTPQPLRIRSGKRQQAQVSASAQAAPCRILVVEDNPTNQLVARKMLEKLGFNCEVAENGQQALELVKSCGPYDLILMDGQMPVMDGYEATAAIRQHQEGGERTPIIAMTASAMADDKTACLNAGMDGYLAKPVALQTLTAVLAEWLPDQLRRAA